MAAYTPKLEIEFISEAEDLFEEIEETLRRSELFMNFEREDRNNLIRKLSKFAYAKYWQGYDDCIITNAKKVH